MISKAIVIRPWHSYGGQGIPRGGINYVDDNYMVNPSASSYIATISDAIWMISNAITAIMEWRGYGFLSGIAPCGNSCLDADWFNRLGPNLATGGTFISIFR